MDLTASSNAEEHNAPEDIIPPDDVIGEVVCGKHACSPYKISLKELRALQGKGWLSDAVVNTAQFLISKQFPEKGGFQDTLLGLNLMFKKRHSFVQILYLQKLKHWVTVTNFGAPRDTVFLYDSMAQAIPEELVLQLANITSLSGNHMNVHVKAAQLQGNGYDCGVFAIANAFTIASGSDPCLVNFEQSEMRTHLVRCIANGEIIHFPSSDLPVRRVTPKRSCFFFNVK